MHLKHVTVRQDLVKLDFTADLTGTGNRSGVIK